MIREITGQETVPFGDGCLALRDTVLTGETCEELWTPAAPHVRRDFIIVVSVVFNAAIQMVQIDLSRTEWRGDLWQWLGLASSIAQA